MLGALNGLLLRPAAPFVGQLPAMTRDTYLSSIGVLMIPALNFKIAGAIAGFVIGLIAGSMLEKHTQSKNRA